MLDTRELGRRPGSQRRVSFAAEAPAELGIEVLGVPEGSPVEFDLRLEAVMEGVLVTGTGVGVSRTVTERTASRSRRLASVVATRSLRVRSNDC